MNVSYFSRIPLGYSWVRSYKRTMTEVSFIEIVVVYTSSLLGRTILGQSLLHRATSVWFYNPSGVLSPTHVLVWAGILNLLHSWDFHPRNFWHQLGFQALLQDGYSLRSVHYKYTCEDTWNHHGVVNIHCLDQSFGGFSITRNNRGQAVETRRLKCQHISNINDYGLLMTDFIHFSTIK